MKTPSVKPVRCAIYTRVSTDHGLDQEFNSLDAQHDAASAYIKSQAHAGWTLIRARYDDGGYSGGSTDRPDLQRLLDDIRSEKIDVIVVYKVDRLTRSLADFAKLVELFDTHGVSFVSVTQQFNTTTSMGRLTLNVLLSFAQFEREVTSERIRDKIAASKRKGLRNGRRPGRLVYSRRPKCHRAIATQLLPKQANRSQHDRTTLAVRPTRPLTAWTPRPRRFGTPPKIRLPAPAPATSRKRPFLIGPI
jgi:DNA invertase Pin-like site-specific DNA recombinase